MKNKIMKTTIPTLLLALFMVVTVTIAPVVGAVAETQERTIYNPSVPTIGTAKTLLATATGTCGPIDLAIVLDDTGSMGGAIGNVVSEIPNIALAAQAASGGDLNVGFVTFGDNVVVKQPLGPDPGLALLLANLGTVGSGGGDAAEPSDEAKNTVTHNLGPGSRPDVLGNSIGSQIGDFSSPWRGAGTLKLAVLITDAPSNGFSEGQPGLDAYGSAPIFATHMANLGNDALGLGINWFDVFVPTAGDYDGQVASMTADATNSGGAFLQVAADGTGTGNAITKILDTCGHPTGISLSPATATNLVGTDHTVTATVADTAGVPQVGITVNFVVVSGPNAGTTGSAVTDASGIASFIYTGKGGVGTDTIQASFTDKNGVVVTSNTVTKDWTAPLGKISGLKFSDVNRNGVKDAGEPVLGGWTINLLDSKGNVIATTTTAAADGTYSFPNLADGTYTVEEVQQLGWMVTLPSTGTYSETITGGNAIPDVNFGNTNTGSISGLKFNDLNGNGKQDAGEPGLANWEIVLTDTSGASISAFTDGNGNYVFDPVVAGKYTLSEVVTLGWKQTFPAAPGTYSITVNAGDNLANNNFGNVKIDGKMTGGGSVFMKDGTRVTHGFELNCNTANTPNNLEVNWGKGNKFHLDTLKSAICYDDKAIVPNPPSAGFDTYVGSGAGSYNGVAGATAKWTFTDAGEPGKNDKATLLIMDAKGNVVLDVSGLLKNGNQQAHAP